MPDRRKFIVYRNVGDKLLPKPNVMSMSQRIHPVEISGLSAVSTHIWPCELYAESGFGHISDFLNLIPLLMGNPIPKL